MRNFGVVFATVLVSLLAMSQSRYYDVSVDEADTYSIIDPIIKGILEALKPKLANLKVDDVNKTINSPNVNASILVNNILVKNADKFVINNLKSTVLPLRLANLTLSWDDITASAAYDVKSSIVIGDKGPFNIFGKGNAKVVLGKIFFTIGANIELKDGIQIKPKGLFGFDLRIPKADVTLTSLMGSTDLGNAMGVFLSKMIPELIETLKKPVFDAFHDDIVRFVNQFLKKNGTTFLADDDSFPEVSFGNLETLDLTSELGSFFSDPLDVDGSEENEEDF